LDDPAAASPDALPSSPPAFVTASGVANIPRELCPSCLLRQAARAEGAQRTPSVVASPEIVGSSPPPEDHPIEVQFEIRIRGKLNSTQAIAPRYLCSAFVF
jgi:hypothetical protein